MGTQKRPPKRHVSALPSLLLRKLVAWSSKAAHFSRLTTTVSKVWTWHLFTLKERGWIMMIGRGTCWQVVTWQNLLYWEWLGGHHQFTYRAWYGEFHETLFLSTKYIQTQPVAISKLCKEEPTTSLGDFSDSPSATGNKGRLISFRTLLKLNHDQTRVDWIPVSLPVFMFCCLGMVVSSSCKKSQLGTPGCRFALHLGSQMLKKILKGATRVNITRYPARWAFVKKALLSLISC